MEGVGARLGRSSTRYGPATVFSGPVRKWKKKWVHVSNPNSNTLSNPNNGSGNNNSHLLLYKWTPISSQNNSSTATVAAAAITNVGKEAASTAPATAPEEPLRRKFRYVPVSVIEEQKQEAAAKTDDESKARDVDLSPRPTQSDCSDGKPNKAVSMEESQTLGKDQAAQQEAIETNLDLSLGLKARERECETDQKVADHSGGGGQLERADSGVDVEMKPATNSEVDNKTKRKVVVPDLEMRV